MWPLNTLHFTNTALCVDSHVRLFLLGMSQGSLAAVARLEGELEAASAKYVLVQGLKAYVADLCNMLQVG